MCNRACIDFGRSHLTPDDVAGRRVLEVGALDVNGSLRPVVEDMGPARYVGVDLVHGPGVDEVCDAVELVARYGPESFDLVLCTEVVEHTRDWRGVVANLKGVLAPGGVLLLTTRAPGFKYHGYPHDFWRYALDDLRAIFSDLRILALEPDPLAPGVFVKARKPEGFVANDVSGHALHSVLTGDRRKDVGAREILAFTARYRLARLLPQSVRDAVAARRGP